MKKHRPAESNKFRRPMLIGYCARTGGPILLRIDFGFNAVVIDLAVGFAANHSKHKHAQYERQKNT